MKQKLEREFEVLEAECNCLSWNPTRVLGLTPLLHGKCYRNFNIYNVQNSGLVPCPRIGFKKLNVDAAEDSQMEENLWAGHRFGQG